MNDFLIILGFVILVIILLIILYILQYNNINESIIRIDEAESRIDSSLRDKYDLFNRLIPLIKAKTDENVDAFKEIAKLKARKLTNFDLDRFLMNAYNDFLVIFNNSDVVHDDEEIKKCFKQIGLIDDELVTLRNYYNNNITTYNKMVKKFPTNIVAKINKYKEKLFYDLKDMSDDDKEDFKL